MIYTLRHYLFFIILVGILSASFHGLGLIKAVPWHLVYSDTLGFFDRVAAPGFAYISKPIEYPILTGFFIQLAGMIGKTKAGYYLASITGLIACAAIATYFLCQILPELQRGRLLKYWIFAPSMLIFLTSNWDVFAITLVAIFFYLLYKEQPYWASFFLALAFSAKFYPILYLAPLLLKKPNLKEWLKILGIFSITVLALNGYFLIYHFNTWSYFYTLNTFRDPNPDSIWTIIRYFIYPMEVKTVNWLSLILFGSSYFYLIWRHRRESLLKLFMLATLLFVLCNKIFSPQYVLWLLPFFVLYFPPPSFWFYLLEFSNLGAFFAILPWFFLGHNLFYFYLSAPFVILRHIVLFYIFFKGLDKKSN